MGFETSLENASQDNCSHRGAADWYFMTKHQSGRPSSDKKYAAVFLEVLPQKHFSYMKSFHAKLQPKTIHVIIPLD